MRRLISTFFAGLMLAGIAGVRAEAQTALTIGTSANPEVTALYVAKEEGIFKKNGLDVKIEIVALNPNLPASLLSNSIQIGAVTPTVFMQAIDNRLELAAIGGISVVNPGMARVYLVARDGVEIAKPKDLEGKTVSVPGLNAILHVALQQWMKNSSADPAKVKFVEAPLPTVGDLLKSGKVDASVAVDPFLSRIEQAGSAKLVAPFLLETMEGKQTHFYTTTADWAKNNAAAIASFRKSIDEAAAFIAANPDKSRTDMNVYLKLPPEALANIALPKSKVTLEDADLTFFAGVMKSFGLMSGNIEPAKIRVK
ncbi:ABC transporter substrate-binding protein [Rhizobium rhizogenes]|uniref:ABC transporter substrate-binding protein n=1 Tax=Rhizobium rhizogenes TaxID=359 RepID=UPI001572091E|nr:ABC transporter substrate-binding protein [Rhizobium rhizogenes]NTI78469.1 ABC transporter substrate-binding protein [Rhizobium rhizogenes]